MLNTISEIILICKRYRNEFGISEYEDRGIFNSELLLVYSMAKWMNIKLIIESGRARGHSTKTLAANLPDTHIISLDNSDNDDIKYSNQQLTKFRNVKLIKADSKVFLSRHINQVCLILIDGPKGNEATKMASQLIQNPRVKAIFIHDVYKPSPERTLIEETFQDTFFTDNLEYVFNFNSLDTDCWKKLAETKGIPESPYYRRGKRIESYASTLGMIFK